MKQLVVVLLLLAAACGGGGVGPILNDPKVKQLLEGAKREIEASSLDMNFKKAYVDGCTRPWLDESLVEAWSYASTHPGAKGYFAPDMEGFWREVDPGGCKKVAQEGRVPLDSSCVQPLTYTEQGNGQITQQYETDSVSGRGNVAWLIGVGEETAPDASRLAMIVQTNSASGSGCKQELVNLMSWGAEGNWKVGGQYPRVRPVWVFNAILSSTCEAPKWQCVYLGMFKP
ncbi:MAG: hypothetical protein JNK82_19475 [Myxococcaceae bacterium]|nr:hypothetical protein [Myxococcaceae bacterium]